MADAIVSKVCSRCKIEKPLDEYNFERRYPDGRAITCKSCRSEYRKRYYSGPLGKAANKRNAHTDAAKRARAKYNQTESAKARRRENRRSETGKRLSKAYYERNKAKCFARSAVNGAVKYKRLPDPDTLACYRCGQPAKEYHHHKGYGREHWLDVVPVCRPCHVEIDYLSSPAATSEGAGGEGGGLEGLRADITDTTRAISER